MAGNTKKIGGNKREGGGERRERHGCLRLLQSLIVINITGPECVWKHKRSLDWSDNTVELLCTTLKR